MAIVKDPLKAIFREVTSITLRIDADQGAGLSADFFLPGSSRDSILRTHIRLLQDNPEYAATYQAMKTDVQDLDEVLSKSYRAQILMSLSSPSHVLTLTPVLFPLRTLRADRNDDKLFSIYTQTPEAMALKAQQLPGRRPYI
jgi:hypothetical protein